MKMRSDPMPVLICRNGEQSCDPLSPYIILSLAPALELDDPTRHSLQGKVAAVPTALEQVAAGPS